MVQIGAEPILWHIMSHYAKYGFKDFVVALGYRGYVIKEYFANLAQLQADIQVDLASATVSRIQEPQLDWKVTLVETGMDTMTGGRLRRLAPYLGDSFMLTYGDGLSDVDIHHLVEFHNASGGVATVTAVSPQPRFGALEINGPWVTSFSEKPHNSQDRINGGFFVFGREVFEYLGDDSTVLELEPLARLARENQLAAYQHDGFWLPMDTVRDRDELNRLWHSGAAPWV